MPDAARRQAGLADPPLGRVVFTAQDLAARVEALGSEITDHYAAAENLLVIGLLKGTFIFVSDLVRRIDRPLQVDFLVAASYGSGTTSSGDVRLLYDPGASLRDRDVLLVEDIVDSGATIDRIYPLLKEREPRSLELCTLLHKRIAGRLTLEPRWVGFDAPNEFLVGYGLDYNENYRHLPYIASL